MRGNGGSDLFVIPAANSGTYTIEDFTVGDGDVIDLSRVLQGSSSWLTNYLKVNE